jgi:hypothetical protein
LLHKSDAEATRRPTTKPPPNIWGDDPGNSPKGGLISRDSTVQTHPRGRRPGSEIYPDLPNYVATEAVFIAAVNGGIPSLEECPTVDRATLVAELRQMIHGKA